MKRVHDDFENDRARGIAGEEVFVRGHPGFARNNVGDITSVDVVHVRTGTLVEVKSDYSRFAKLDSNFDAVNFQIQFRKECGDPAGPFAALEGGAAFIVKQFPAREIGFLRKPTKTYYYECLPYLKRALQLRNTGREFVGKGYKQWYLFPIALFADLALTREEFLERIEKSDRRNL